MFFQLAHISDVFAIDATIPGNFRRKYVIRVKADLFFGTEKLTHPIGRIHESLRNVQLNPINSAYISRKEKGVSKFHVCSRMDKMKWKFGNYVTEKVRFYIRSNSPDLIVRLLLKRILSWPPCITTLKRLN